MLETTYYRLSLLLPILLPAIGALALLISDALRESGAGYLLRVLIAASAYGLLPYSLFCGAIVWLLWNRSARAHLLASLLAPPAFALLIAACVVAFALAGGGPPDYWSAAGYYALWTLPVACFYIVVCHALRLLLIRRGLVRVGSTAG